MILAIGIIDSVLKIGNTLLERLLPNREAADKAKLEMLKLVQTGEFKKLELAVEAIVTEARSTDPWTSRTRPSFLYIMYIMILAAIPFGILYAFNPQGADRVAQGFKAWLDAIPDSLWTLFDAGYLGYSGLRSFDK